MILNLVKIILILLLPIQVLNANVIIGSFNVSHQLRFGVVIEPHLQGIENILGPALALLNAALVEKLELQNKAGGPYDFIIEVTNRKNVEIRNSGDNRILYFNRGIQGDAYSLFYHDSPGSPIIVRVLWDEAMTEIKNGKSVERPDAFARLVTLLGHEIYGNVLNLRKKREILESSQIKYSETKQNEEWLKSEVSAFRSGIEFISTLLKRLGPQLSVKMKSDFLAALEREKKSLSFYEDKLDSLLGNSGSVIFLSKINRCKLFY
ncbi:MAG: hypothetical protein J0M15_06655 [Deltaproteobacteria bacterium]|jgi:hypothetical protein|nr:hypothetical protein [Deltaproteobacteria bacterium]